MRRVPERLLLFVSILMSSMACSSKMGPPGEEAYKRHLFDGFYRKDPYGETFMSNTRREIVQSEFDNSVFFDVTQWNLKLREAYIDEMKRVYRMPDQESLVLEGTELKDEEKNLVFIVSVSTRKPEWRDFDRPNSIWRLLIEDPSGKIQVRSEKIEKINDRDERNRYFYRTMNRFATTYRVSVPRKAFENESTIIFRLTSPVGEAEFEFPNRGPTAQSRIP